MNNIIFFILLTLASICMYLSRPTKANIIYYDPSGDESLDFLLEKLNEDNLSIDSGNRIVKVILKRIIKKLDMD